MTLGVQRHTCREWKDTDLGLNSIMESCKKNLEDSADIEVGVVSVILTTRKQ